MMRRAILVVLFALPVPAAAQARKLSPQVERYVSINQPAVALIGVRVIDGTGGPARTNQTVVIEGDRIAAVGPTDRTTIPAQATRLELAGHTVIPGLIGLHDHMYYSSGAGGSMKPMLQSYPRLFLGAGVTTIRTTGSVDSYQELNLKRSIAEGSLPGPEIFVTGPYLQGPGPGPGAMHPLTGPDDATRLVRYWSEEGVSWFKAYTQITRAELGAAIAEAHRHGAKVTGHLCSVGFTEAVDLGIDNLEHGFLDNLEWFPGKQPDQCPMDYALLTKTYAALDVNGPAVQATIRTMVAKKVAMTSTLAVIELGSGGGPVPRDPRVLDALFPAVAVQVDTFYAQAGRRNDTLAQKAFRNTMAFERAFVAAGGLLGAGSDPCCLSAIAGFADQRNFELLLEAGFSAEEAVRIMTLNGAKILGIDDTVGTIAAGKQADLVVLRGDPAAGRSIRDVATVFRRGLGFDSAKLLESVRGLIGLR